MKVGKLILTFHLEYLIADQIALASSTERVRIICMTHVGGLKVFLHLALCKNRKSITTECEIPQNFASFIYVNTERNP